MIKLKDKHFKLFKATCEKYQNKWELNNWQIYYEFKEIPGSYGQAKINYTNRVATITCNTEWEELGITNLNHSIKETAKHEMIHVMVGGISSVANSRFVTVDESEQVEEALVRKLSWLL